MPKKQDPSLSVELKPSKRLKQLLTITYALALGSSIANTLPIAVKLALLLGICMHFCFAIKRLNNEQYTIKHTEALDWEIANSNDFESIQILNSTVVTQYAIFLHFNKNSRKQSVLIVNDALSEDDYRCLITRLKTAGKK